MSLPEHMILECFEMGPLQNFLYLIGDERTKEIAVVDPAWDVDFLCRQAEQKGYTIVSVFLTHGHPDHVNGLDKMLTRHDVPVYISKHEHPCFMPQHKNIHHIDDGHVLCVGGIEFQCIWTPGHSSGCQIFLHKNMAIAGDAIFIDGCGHCQLPGTDPKSMYNSLYNIIMKFPDETVIYPGHNYGSKPYDTIGEQKKTNPFLLCSNEEEFVHGRMGY